MSTPTRAALGARLAPSLRRHSPRAVQRVALLALVAFLLFFKLAAFCEANEAGHGATPSQHTVLADAQGHSDQPADEHCCSSGKAQPHRHNDVDLVPSTAHIANDHTLLLTLAVFFTTPIALVDGRQGCGSPPDSQWGALGRPPYLLSGQDLLVNLSLSRC